MKGAADYVAEILREKDRGRRQLALSRVPAHLRETVKANVGRYWKDRAKVKGKR